MKITTAKKPFEQTVLPPALDSSLRLYRRLWLSKVDLEEAKATIDELLKAKLPIPRRHQASPLLMALTTALVISYARPFINSRGSSFADRTLPGSLLRVLSKGQRELHEIILEIRNREAAHSDADAMELSLKLYWDGDSAILRIAREPFLRSELRYLRRIIEKLEREIQKQCAALRETLPLETWI